jgi:hypothetical protein
MGKIERYLPNDEYQAAVGANNASSSNVFATIADLTSGSGTADKIIFDAKYDEAGGILKGQAVYVSGANGTNILVSKADYTTEATSSKTLGLVVVSGANNFQGQVISDGLLSNIDTSAAGAEGDPVWLGDDGNLIYGLVNKPYAPNHLVFIGIVTKKNASTGEIFVKVQNGFELNEIHDVDVKSSLPTDGQVLTYDSVTGLWRNETPLLGSDITLTSAGGSQSLVNDGTGPTLAVKGLSAGGGILLAPSVGNDFITISNVSPASSVTLTSAGGTETLINDGTGPTLATKGITAGTGISLSSTATDLTVTNAAPDQVVALTAGTGINVTGTYPNFTIDNTGALSDVNIYNADGTLIADRVVNMNNFGLTLNGGTGSNGSQINITAPSNRAKGLNFQVGSGLRWKQQVSGVELGGDIGSQLSVSYYDDAGVLKGTAFSISRTNGAFRLNNAYNLPTAAGTLGQVMRTNGSGIVSFQSLPVEIQVAASDETTPLTLGNGKITFRMPHGMTLTEVRASLTTAQVSGAIFRIDVIQNGVSVLSTKCTIDNTERTSTMATTLPVISVSALADDSEMRVDIIQVGDGTAKGLKVTLIGTRA